MFFMKTTLIAALLAATAYAQPTVERGNTLIAQSKTFRATWENKDINYKVQENGAVKMFCDRTFSLYPTIELTTRSTKSKSSQLTERYNLSAACYNLGKGIYFTSKPLGSLNNDFRITAEMFPFAIVAFIKMKQAHPSLFTKTADGYTVNITDPEAAKLFHIYLENSSTTDFIKLAFLGDQTNEKTNLLNLFRAMNQATLTNYNVAGTSNVAWINKLQDIAYANNCTMRVKAKGMKDTPNLISYLLRTIEKGNK